MSSNNASMIMFLRENLHELPHDDVLKVFANDVGSTKKRRVDSNSTAIIPPFTPVSNMTDLTEVIDIEAENQQIGDVNDTISDDDDEGNDITRVEHVDE